jgi:hypothetical protein
MTNAISNTGGAQGRFRTIMLAALLVAASAAPAQAADNLIAYSAIPSILPWTVGGDISVSQSGTPLAAHRLNVGFQSPFAASAVPGTLTQSFVVPTTGTYRYGVRVGRSESSGGQDDVPLRFVARVGNLQITDALPSFTTNICGNCPTIAAGTVFDSTVFLEAGLRSFSFEFERGESGFGRSPFFVIDDVFVEAVAPPTGGVPEPASWALLVTGFGLTGAAMRRRGHRRVAA